ncbi:MAG: hypothetical protein M1819_002322 [Sarea resinae]|nr:MAG: hypothetical protein M1819_002322 [Sarea resinae]
MSDSEDLETGVPLLESSPSATPEPSAKTSTKRKREDGTVVESKRAAKKKKSKKTKYEGDADLDLEAGINHAIGKMDGRLLADYVAQRTKRFESDLSLMELEEKYLPEKSFRDTTKWDKPRNLENLPDFLQHFASTQARTKQLDSTPKAAGSPHTIVVTGAGLRAADLTRSLRKFQTKESTVAKLFAKHIKLKDAIEFVKKTKFGIAVGTPARLTDLVQAGALSLDKVHRIMVDSSHIDQKKRGILDMKETQIPLIGFLNLKGLKDRYGQDSRGVDLLFY